MQQLDLDHLKYPIGKFEYPQILDKEQIDKWIEILDSFPKRLEELVKNLSDEQLDTPYRAGGWTVRQVIHHVADSHHHSYTRFKWSLTEDLPLIKAYEEKDWALLFDSKTAPIQLSLSYIKALHAKMVYLLKGLSKDQLLKSYLHPEGKIKVSVQENIGKYAWHSNHHFAHIEGLIKREGW